MPYASRARDRQRDAGAQRGGFRHVGSKEEDVFGGLRTAAADSPASVSLYDVAGSAGVPNTALLSSRIPSHEQLPYNHVPWQGDADALIFPPQLLFGDPLQLSQPQEAIDALLSPDAQSVPDMLPGHLVDASGRGIFYPSMDLDQESTNLDPVGDMGVRYGEPMLHNVTQVHADYDGPPYPSYGFTSMSDNVYTHVQPYQGPVGPADTCTRVPMGVSNYGDSVASTGPDQDPHSICEKPPQAVTIAALRAGPQADTPRANTAKKPFKCDQCPKSYRRHGGLNRHKKDKHLAKLKCGHCCEFYWSAGRQYAYTDHLSSAHPEALNFPSPAASDAGPRSTIPWSDKPGHWRRLGRNH